jgi:hypothetical protein
MWRLLIVVVVAVAAFVAALVHFQAAPRGACVASARHDASYQAQFLDPPTVRSNVYRVAVTKGGEPVTGAQVCVATSRVNMSGLGTSTAGQEVSPGTYQVLLPFPRTGAFTVTVGIVEPGQKPVAVPLTVTASG